MIFVEQCSRFEGEKKTTTCYAVKKRTFHPGAFQKINIIWEFRYFQRRVMTKHNMCLNPGLSNFIQLWHNLKTCRISMHPGLKWGPPPQESQEIQESWATPPHPLLHLSPPLLSRIIVIRSSPPHQNPKSPSPFHIRVLRLPPTSDQSLCTLV